MPAIPAHRLNRRSADGHMLGPFDYRGPLTVEETKLAVPRVFERRAHEFASRPAILGEPGASYGELNRLANRIANAIREASGGANEPVAVFTRKSPLHYAAFIAALKAGKIFIGLDASDPEERISGIIEDAGAALLLCDESTAGAARRAAGTRAGVIQTDRLRDGLAETNLGVEIGPEGPAIIAYTSGSSGRPKGVVHSHRSFIAAVQRQVSIFNLLPDDRHLHAVSPNYMMSHSVAFQALLSGGSIQLADPRATPMASIVEEARRRGATQFFGTPTHLRQLLAAIPPEAPLASMRIIRVAGEPVTSGDAEAVFRATSRDCLFVNGFGATEINTICSFVTSGGEPPRSGVLPVGFPFPDADIMLHDESGDSVAPGEIGEIVVRKGDLSLGYWRRPEETAALFRPAPGGLPGRIYRTGDLGRFLPDGSLEHLGRSDRQVKIRGVRIEIGEIEAALLQEPQVEQAVVVSRIFAPGDERLVAFFLAAPGPRPSCAELRRRLSERLPASFIPALFAQIDALPLTQTGKVDRAALPLDPFVRPETSAPFEPANGETERGLTEIWEATLGIRPIGAADNFFELGGHSLLAAQIMAEAERRFGARLAPAAMLRAPTIRALAAILPASAPAGRDPAVIEFKPGVGPALFIVQEHQRQLFRWWDVIPRLDYPGPIIGVAPSLTLDEQPRYRPVEEQARRCAEIIRAIQPEGPYRLAGFCHGGIIAFEAARSLGGAAPSDVIAVDLPLDSLRFGTLRRAVGAWNKLSGADSLQGLSRFLRLRGRIIRAERALARAARRGFARSLASARRKTRDMFAGAAIDEAPGAASGGATNSADGLSFAYFAAPVQAHFPKPCEARMLHLIGEESAALRGAAKRCAARWRRVARGGFDVRVVPGNHSTMLLRPSADVLAKEIAWALAAGQESRQAVKD